MTIRALALLNDVVLRCLSQLAADLLEELRHEEVCEEKLDHFVGVRAVHVREGLRGEALKEILDDDAQLRLSYRDGEIDEAALLILEDVQEEVAVSVDIHACISDAKQRVRAEVIHALPLDSLDAVARMEDIEDLQALLSGARRHLPIVIEILLDYAAEVGLH